MHRIDIAPVSLNKAYRGRRFATEELKQFKNDMFMLLPKIQVPEGKLSVTYRFGVSSKNTDTDNLIKMTQDSIATQYQFNDKRIYRIVADKIDVEKGEEFIEFLIEKIT